MTVSTLRYGYMAAPWDAPLSLGVHAFIEYNGYVINDRHQADRIRITKITGLDDADVSDSREVVPGDHGETAYDAFYRGRTIMLSGRIEAGSLGTLKRLERDLKAAFAPLVESPMKFRWFDITDTFDDAQTLQNYTAEIGAVYGNSLSVSGGVLRWGTTQNVLLVRTADNRLWGDKIVGVRVVIGSIDASVASVLLAYKDSANYLVASLSGSQLVITAVSAGTPFTLATTTVTGLQQGQPVWLRGRTEGDFITAELWTSPPIENATPNFFTTVWLQGTDADAFGDQVLTLVGFGAQTATTNWVIDDFRVRSLYPGDIIFNVRKMPNGMSISDSQDSPTRFNRTFQITARASQSFGANANQSRSQVFVPSAISTPSLGFFFPLTFPLTFRKFVSGATVPANTFVTVVNRGNVWTRPIIYIYGTVGSFSIINLQNGQEIDWSGNLTDGDYLVFDCARRTLVNSSGANMMKYFSSSSSIWMQLEPGPNDIYFAGLNYSGNTKMVVYSRGAST